MKSHQRGVLAGLLGLGLLALGGMVLTSEWLHPAQPKAARQATADQQPLVDVRPLQRARQVAPLAATAEEQQFAQEALRLGDNAVDVAFASALRQATAHPAPPNPQTRELYARIKRAEAAVKADQEQVAQLTRQASHASLEAKDAIEQQVEVAQAQLALDQDELDDAKQDLARSGGDARSKIQRMLDEHEAAQHAEGQPAGPEPAPAQQNNGQGRSLAAQFRAWLGLHSTQVQLRAAQQEAASAAAALTRAHEAAKQQLQQQPSPGQEAAGPTGAAAQPPGSGGQSGPVARLRQLSEERKNLADLDKRIQDEQELADVYGGWRGLLLGRERAALHALLQSVLAILVILLLVRIADHFIERFFADLTPERKRLLTLRAVARFAAQALGVLLILLVLFGPPNQMPTVLGLAGAGLTVALKDFILAFFGWFVLMGRNGIRLGDWVEINGVGGEVVEIGLLRTVLLETGNWTDAGHPTGRKVSFINSFAIEGHYFNFSTAGQWLWDQLQVLLPGGNPYPLVEAIQRLITKETEANAREAEEEWKRATKRYGVQSFSAAPAIEVRPTSSGVELMARYITRASQRHEVRSRLNQGIVELLHHKEGSESPRESVPAHSATQTSPSP